MRRECACNATFDFSLTPPKNLVTENKHQKLANANKNRQKRCKRSDVYLKRVAPFGNGEERQGGDWLADLLSSKLAKCRKKIVLCLADKILESVYRRYQISKHAPTPHLSQSKSSKNHCSSIQEPKKMLVQERGWEGGNNIPIQFFYGFISTSRELHCVLRNSIISPSWPPG
jgi:hypothetical protein